MPFFARPNLSNEQFKQLSGTTLTLSGTTIFNSKHGGHLNFTDEYGTPIPVVILSADTQNENALKYQNGCLVLGAVAGSGSSCYTGLSPAAISVGGISAGTPLVGRTFTSILQDMLVPALYPTLIPPYSLFSISPSTTSYEVGVNITLTGYSNFNRGCINPQYPPTASPYRSGCVLEHRFNLWGSLACYSVQSNNFSISIPTHKVVLGYNTLSSCVKYNSGVQPYDSKGNPYCTPLPSGYTSPVTIRICGILPYFYGASDSTPVANSSLLSTGTKCVLPSDGSISINFNAVNKYLWLAIPDGTSKVKWVGSNSPTNTESIPGGLFPSKISAVVDSPSGYWSGITYNFYISNYKTCTCEGASFYTMTFTNS